MMMAAPIFETWEPKDPKLCDVAAAMTAWRERVTQSDAVRFMDFGRRTDLAMETTETPTTCADLVLRMITATASAEALGQWLGEALQVLSAAASVRDPRVLNALWPRQQCTVADCGFCDAMDASIQLEVSLESAHVVCDSPLALYHALVSWRNEPTTTECVTLLRAIRECAAPHPSARPLVALVLNLQVGDVLPTHETESAALKFGQTLAGIKRLESDANTRVSQIVVKQAPSGVSVATFNAFVSAIAASGFAFTIGTRYLRKVQTSMQSQAMTMDAATGMSMAPAPMMMPHEQPVWEWLIGSERRLATAPTTSQLKSLHISRYEQSTATFLRLCESLARSTSLQALEINWEWPMDSHARAQETEAMGMLLFSSQSRLRLQSLRLSVLRWSDDVVEAMRRRADRASPPRHERIHIDIHDFQARRSAPPLVLLAAEQTRRLRFNLGRALSCRSALEVMRQSPQLETLDLGMIRPNEEDATMTAASTDGEAPTLSLRELSFFALTDGAAVAVNVTRRSIVAMIDSVRHSLQSLELRLQGPRLDASMASAIVTSCPGLRRLLVSGHDATFLDELLCGYRDGRCRIASLTIELSEDNSASVINLLNQLEDDSQPVTRWLTSLIVNQDCVERDTIRSVGDALVSMLRRNRRLRSIAVVPPLTDDSSISPLNDVAAKFASQPPSRRHRLALLSALRGQALELPECVLLHVWAFSGRPLWRFG
ncbi:hypothetical protein PINS_up012748 [Pythium insidiosum]|nr:hypothetical protein PINS_up012748 [Pythium insidiosum]